jgi:basic membrane protein A and related proteins
MRESMMMMMVKRSKVAARAGAVALAALTALTALAALALPVAARAAEPLKMGFVYLGPVGDGGWTYAHDLGRRAMERALGDKVKATIVENVPENADAERVIRDLAVKGNKIIFTTSFGYMEQTLKVAKSFPGVQFYHATGFKSAPNVHIYNSRMYEPAYLAGIIAGHMTKTGKLGFVASFPIPEVVRNINAYTMGARSVNPAITTKVVWVSTWFDPSKERQAAETLIGAGADVLLQNTDSPATLQTAQDKGVYAFGWDSEMTAQAPRAHLASAVQGWGGYYTRVAEAALAGRPLTETVWGGIPEGMTDLVAINPVVPAAVQREVAETRARIASRATKVFSGPIKQQDGAIRVAAGASLSDKEIDSVDWYVEGVEGRLPGK